MRCIPRSVCSGYRARRTEAGAPALSRRASLFAVAGAIGLLAVSGRVALAAEPAPSGTPEPGDIFVLGDSWAAGLYANPVRALGQAAAGFLGLVAEVDAIPGTGYVNSAGARNYLQRAHQVSGSPRLVVVQGGSNDDGFGLDALAANARQTMRVLQQRSPAAKMMVLGPGPDPEPVTTEQRAIDATLQAAARALRVPYVSMLQEDWIPAALAESVIDPATRLPTITGQEYLGLRLAASIRLVYPELTL